MAFRRMLRSLGTHGSMLIRRAGQIADSIIIGKSHRFSINKWDFKVPVASRKFCTFHEWQTEANSTPRLLACGG